MKLLRLMGWKYGQGIGPRVKRKHKHPGAHDQRVLGPALPSAGYDVGTSCLLACIDRESSPYQLCNWMKHVKLAK